MNMFQIAIDNLKQRKIKMLFLVICLVVAVATVISLYSIVNAMRLELGNRLDEFGPNIVITPRAEGLELNYLGKPVTDVKFDVQLLTEKDLPLIRTIPDGASVNIISPKIIGAISLGDISALLVGIELKNEFAMKPWFSLRDQSGVETGGQKTDLALLDLPDDGLIVGSGLADAYEIQPGESILVNGQNFTVTGVLNELGSDEDGLVYANLPVVQKLLGRPGEFSMIEVSGFCNFCPIEDMTKQLADVLPNGSVTALRQAALVREETIDRFSAYGITLSVVVLIISALAIMVTMLSSVNERTREIGIFRAIGFRRTHIAKIILLETLVVSLLAGALGYVLGSIVAQIAGPFLAQMQVAILWNAALILPSIILSTLLATAAALYPAIKAANLDPVEALRFI